MLVGPKSQLSDHLYTGPPVVNTTLPLLAVTQLSKVKAEISCETVVVLFVKTVGVLVPCGL